MTLYQSRPFFTNYNTFTSLLLFSIIFPLIITMVLISTNSVQGSNESILRTILLPPSSMYQNYNNDRSEVKMSKTAIEQMSTRIVKRSPRGGGRAGGGRGGGSGGGGGGHGKGRSLGPVGAAAAAGNNNRLRGNQSLGASLHVHQRYLILVTMVSLIHLLITFQFFAHR